MATPFSEAFVRLRREAGFETAYQFFHKNGGPKVFQCSFPNYLRIEKGSHLPQPRRLPLLCQLLRLPLTSDEARELVHSYLVTWTGSKDLADWMLDPFTIPAKQAPSTLDPAQSALRKLVRETAKPISMAQYLAIMENEASYWVYRVLTTSNETYSAEALSKVTGLPAAAMERGAEILRRAGLAAKARDGGYRSQYSGEFLIFPDPSTIPPEVMQRVYEYNQKMIKRRGAVVDERYMGVRADGRALQGFLPHFREAIRSVNAYSTTEKSERSGLYFVEGKVFKLFDF